MASRTPCASKFPNPVSGTLAPPPAQSMSLGYNPTADSRTPATTYPVRIRAGVNFVKNGRLTDTSYSNIALFDGNRWVTPAHPLLKGTMRQSLIDKGLLKEKGIKYHGASASHAGKADGNPEAATRSTT